MEANGVDAPKDPESLQPLACQVTRQHSSVHGHHMPYHWYWPLEPNLLQELACWINVSGAANALHELSDEFAPKWVELFRKVKFPWQTCSNASSVQMCSETTCPIAALRCEESLPGDR